MWDKMPNPDLSRHTSACCCRRASQPTTAKTGHDVLAILKVVATQTGRTRPTRAT